MIRKFEKYRYSHVMRPFFDGLSKIGLRIAPYYEFRENVSPDFLSPCSGLGQGYEIGFWEAPEIKQMAKIPGRRFSEEELLKRLEDGHRCLGIKKDNKLAAFSWCNFRAKTFRWHRLPLNDREVFLFDAFTLPEFRGRKLAPVLRYNLYRELTKQGYTGFYSYSDFFNTPAIKFKKTLKAKKEQLNLYIVLFDKFVFHFRLKQYPQ